MLTVCPSCGTVNVDTRTECYLCHTLLRARPRVRTDTTPIVPEAIEEEITARLRALPSHTERTVYTWPDEPVDPKEVTKV